MKNGPSPAFRFAAFYISVHFKDPAGIRFSIYGPRYKIQSGLVCTEIYPHHFARLLHRAVYVASAQIRNTQVSDAGGQRILAEEEHVPGRIRKDLHFVLFYREKTAH